MVRWRKGKKRQGVINLPEKAAENTAAAVQWRYGCGRVMEVFGGSAKEICGGSAKEIWLRQCNGDMLRQCKGDMAAAVQRRYAAARQMKEGSAGIADGGAAGKAGGKMAIRVEHLNYIYGEGTAFEQYALKDVSVSIEDGQFVGLIGHTGSGKSTLTQHLNGLLRASSGQIYFHGENIYAEGYDMKALRSKVGLVFQYPEQQLFEVDVFSDVCFGPRNLGLSKDEIEERAKDALAQVGMGEGFYRKSPFELSGGQNRRGAGHASGGADLGRAYGRAGSKGKG